MMLLFKIYTFRLQWHQDKSSYSTLHHLIGYNIHNLGQMRRDSQMNSKVTNRSKYNHTLQQDPNAVNSRDAPTPV